jgi:fumarate hydratase, class II
MMRKERDALGEILVPDGRYYGAQTQRALEHFQIGCERFHREFVGAHALVKKAAARVNALLGDLEPRLAKAIEQAADEIQAGKWDDQFPLVIWQSGSGTQFNMNVNEVIANRANEILGGSLGAKAPVHPNDHVNMSQSTNDTVPTSIHIAAVGELRTRLLPALGDLITAVEVKSNAWRDIVKIGRTHLQDATPLTLGQEFSGYASQLAQCRDMIHAGMEYLYSLPIGGTAVGTGLNTRKGYDEKMILQFRELTGDPQWRVGNKFSGLAGHEAVLNVSGALKTLAAAMMKIANDLRWLAGGPRCGLGELVLPANEPGSSIMPGKVNPTQCEMVTMVCCQVFGNDAAIALAGSQGHLELNVFKPLLAYALLQSIQLIGDACRSFNQYCIAGLEPNPRQIDQHVRNSLMLAAALNKHIGYDKSAEIALKAWREDKTLKQAALELGFVSEADFDLWINPGKMIGPEE